MKGELFCFLLACGVASLQLENTGILPIYEETKECQEITVPECTLLGYNMTYMPNLRDQINQSHVRKEFKDFLPLVVNKCSNAILHFLCSFYVPACLTDPETQTVINLRPCRNLCEYVRPDCEDAIQKADYEWPTFFNCSLETFSNQTSCFGPDDLKSVQIPESIFVTATTVEVISTSKSIPLISSSVTILCALTSVLTDVISLASLWRLEQHCIL